MFDAQLFDNGIFDVMATIGIKLTSVCAGGDHLTLTLTPSVGQPIVVVITNEDFAAALSAEEKQAFAMTSLRLFAQGKTVQQVKTALQSTNGVVVTV